TLIARMAESGALLLPVLWHGERPLAVFAILKDPVKRSLLFLIGGRDESFNAPPPGFILHAHTIRYAIQEGFRTYDFSRGNEPYKYLYGAEERRLASVTVSTRNKRNLGGHLDPRSLAWVLDQATVLHRKGRLPEAERTYRQILD